MLLKKTLLQLIYVFLNRGPLLKVVWTVIDKRQSRSLLLYFINMIPVNFWCEWLRHLDILMKIVDFFRDYYSHVYAIAVPSLAVTYELTLF